MLWIFAEVFANCCKTFLKYPKSNELFIIKLIISFASVVPELGPSAAADAFALMKMSDATADRDQPVFFFCRQLACCSSELLFI